MPKNIGWCVLCGEETAYGEKYCSTECFYEDLDMDYDGYEPDEDEVR
jgi:hypothetical protein